MELTALKNKLKKYRYMLIIPAVISVAYYVLIIRNPLPSDEEMIEHFYSHRDDIEELVKRYRNYPVGPPKYHGAWNKDVDTKQLLIRAGVDGIDHSAFSPWLPNSYSIETAKKIKQEIRNAKPTEAYKIFYNYGALIIALAPREYYRAIHLRYFHIWKDFYFIPEVPRIENGEMLWPVNTRGEYSARRRVLPSLNLFPKDWKDYECVLRQIEAHWFISMCNGH